MWRCSNICVYVEVEQRSELRSWPTSWRLAADRHLYIRSAGQERADMLAGLPTALHMMQAHPYPCIPVDCVI